MGSSLFCGPNIVRHYKLDRKRDPKFRELGWLGGCRV